MDREEVIRLAHQEGVGIGYGMPHIDALVRFASLVAAAEKEKAAQIVDQCCSVCAMKIRALT